MGRRRKRLIVQADLTSEEDQAFLAWVEEKRRKRRLAEEIRKGLRIQYERARGQAALTYPSPSQVMQSVQQGGLDEGKRVDSGTNCKLKKLVQSF